jgi:hypothetical protein
MPKGQFLNSWSLMSELELSDLELSERQVSDLELSKRQVS